MTTPKRMIAEPTTKIVSVWPRPHTLPMSAAWRMLRCLLTIVETATT